MDTLRRMSPRASESETSKQFGIGEDDSEDIQTEIQEDIVTPEPEQPRTPGDIFQIRLFIVAWVATLGVVIALGAVM